MFKDGEYDVIEEDEEISGEEREIVNKKSRIERISYSEVFG